jgi:RNA polymerase-binding transcription factor DksA
MAERTPPPPAVSAQVLRSLRRTLVQREETLRKEVAAATEATRREESDRMADVIDRKESANEEIQVGIGEAEVERDLHELRAIAAALQRINNGQCGICVDCGESIDEPRLAAMPTAIRCAACQDLHERRESP